MYNHPNNTLFKTRYIDRNKHINLGYALNESKKYIKNKITQNPLKSIYLTSILLIIVLIKRIYTSRKSRDIKAKIKANPLKALYLVPFYMLSKVTFIKFLDSHYPHIRIKCGKIDIPYCELVLTTRCTLRCESCNNLMQYFDSKNAYTCTFEGICAALDRIFDVVDSIGCVRIIGGEPLLFKDIAKVAKKLANEPKVGYLNIVTNGTIKFSDELLDILANTKKCSVTISDYSKSPNLKVKLYQQEIIQSLKNCDIAYDFILSNDSDRWYDPGKIYKRNRTRENIIKNFKSCLMPCVSVMSNEGIPNRGGAAA